MKYKDIIDMNESFQYSINLQFDIGNINKIKEYIPTKDSSEVIEYYIDSIYGNGSKATTLIGPYGKGKSHLLLVLLTLLNNYNKADEESIRELLQKIRIVNQEIYNKINDIRNQELKYLPVIINSNYDNLNQAFLLAISEALERENLQNITVNTHFESAVQVIKKWQQEGYEEAIKKFRVCLEDKKLSIEKLVKMLEKYDEKGYSIFEEVYSLVMHGMTFNPLINTDIIKFYKDVAYKLTEFNYNGLIIVFDEFSKFLEYSNNKNITRDLKMLQDFAELASRTGKIEQILFSCITHKSIGEYIKNLTEDKVNAFRTVEGRFREIRFHRSMGQNYEIVSQAILKKEKFEGFFKQYYESHIDFYKELAKEFSFINLDDTSKVLIKGCFPLNPITVFSVIHLSEKIAQNERTLFTFLADDDRCSFKNYIKTDETNQLFSIDKVYDYFSSILRKTPDEAIKSIYIKTEGAISRTTNINEVKILKAISIMQMVNEFEELLPKYEHIRLSIGMKEKDFEIAITNLKENSIIKLKRTSNIYDFTTMYNKRVLEEIEEVILHKFDKISLKETLTKAYDLDYIIPRKYNQEYKMTRFFKNIFMLEEEVLLLNKFDVLFDQYFADGFIVNIIKQEGNNTDRIKEKVMKINDDRVIVKISNRIHPKEFIYILKQYEAIQYLKNAQINDISVAEELIIIEEEVTELIGKEVSNTYSNNNTGVYLYLDKSMKEVKNLSTFVSEICEKIYKYTPIINNEMVNKRELSSPIIKARDLVIESIINNNKNELIKTDTSAEATIYKAIIDKQDNLTIQKILCLIREYIEKADSQKISLAELCQKLHNKPYGVRKGILPILITIVIGEYIDELIIYFQNKEIDINSDNIRKMIENPDKYYILLEKGTMQKKKFVSSFLEIFNLSNMGSNRKNIKLLIETMENWILALPRIVRDLLNTNNIIKEESFIKFKMELLKTELNKNEFLFIKLPEIFECNYDKVIDRVQEAKTLYDNYVLNYSNYLIMETKELFEHKSKSNLGTVLNNWYKSIEYKVESRILELETKQFLEYIKKINGYNELEVVQSISSILLGTYIEDWQEETYSLYLEKLNNIIITVENIQDTNNEDQEMIKIDVGNTSIKKYINRAEISGLGKTLKNNIEDSLNEYGNSISENEKIKILLTILHKYL